MNLLVSNQFQMPISEEWFRIGRHHLIQVMMNLIFCLGVHGRMGRTVVCPISKLYGRWRACVGLLTPIHKILIIFRQAVTHISNIHLSCNNPDIKALQQHSEIGADSKNKRRNLSGKWYSSMLSCNFVQPTSSSCLVAGQNCPVTSYSAVFYSH